MERMANDPSPTRQTRIGSSQNLSSQSILRQPPPRSSTEERDVCGSVYVFAEVAVTLKGFEAEEFDRGSEVTVPGRFLAQEIGGQVFLIVIGEDGDHNGVRTKLLLHFYGSQKVAARGNTNGKAQICGQLLSHQDRIAVRDANDFVQGRKMHDGRDELVGYSLDAVRAHFAACRESGRFGRLDRVNPDAGVPGAKESSNPHHRSAGANAGHEGIRSKTCGLELGADLGTRGGFMRFHVGVIGELAGQENARLAGGKFLRHANAAEKSALLFTDQDNPGTVAANQILAFAAHPVRHENRHRMTQSGADGGKGNAGVAAGGFRDDVAGMDLILRVSLPENVQGHAVLDAAGHVQLFGLGVNRTLETEVAEVDAQERSVAG
jgi:hypothetical protein